MKIKFCVKVNDMDGNYINDVGELEVSKFEGYELFSKLYERMEGEGSKCGVSKKEFEERFEVLDMGDWIMIGDVDDVENMSFVKC